ncbi:MAG: pyridoxamine 5'-phosphate oxidase family protein [Gemmatimonadetes bacterium]|nr:pyridoxamine 5'-phosphate oxidase family protein [Gemmatimonadota bacterium]
MPPDRAAIRTHRERDVGGDAPRILAAGIVAHVAIADEHGPVVIPMTYHYDPDEPDRIHLHGGHHSRLMGALASGTRVSIGVTLTDGLVYSKSALNHSVNYRSAVVFGRAAADQGSLERQRSLLQAMIARYWPGRTAGVDYGITPDRDLKATAFVTIEIEQLSAKRRVGGPKGPGDDDPAVPGTAGVSAVPDLG